jgi:hypothetical protein
MVGRIFALIGVAVAGMLVTGALSESFGVIATGVGMFVTAMAIFWVWRSSGRSSE